MTKTQTQTRTRPVIRTRTEADVALRQANLTALEENVLRMRYGIALDPAAALRWHGEENPALSGQLQVMEAEAVANLQAQGQGEVDAVAKAALIARLRKL